MANTSRKFESIQAKHAEYLSNWKKGGGHTLLAVMPCCGEELELPAPNDKSTWDSLMRCVHCDAGVFKVVTRTAVKLEVLHV